MGGLILLVALSVVMALASFLAGALPLSMSLSQTQLRSISSIGIGILVGTSLIVIIPEGVEAVAMTSLDTHAHKPRSMGLGPNVFAPRAILHDSLHTRAYENVRDIVVNIAREEEELELPQEDAGDEATEKQPPPKTETPANKEHEDHVSSELPTFYIGLSLICGFVLMFLIDRLPKHATDQFQTAPATRHISLDNLSSNLDTDEEAEDVSFLGSLTPTPRQSRSLATTTGLVIHAAADGIAMGASATTEDMKLGFIIFIAIMIHKAPAAFGLTSVLLRQGLSKRAARGHLVVFSLAAPAGALTTYLIITILGSGKVEGEAGTWWTGMLLLFSAGTFLYVAMHAMNEEHQHESSTMNGSTYSDGNGMSSQGRRSSKPQMRDTFFTVTGMLLPLLTQFGHHH